MIRPLTHSRFSSCHRPTYQPPGDPPRLLPPGGRVSPLPEESLLLTGSTITIGGPPLQPGEGLSPPQWSCWIASCEVCTCKTDSVRAHKKVLATCHEFLNNLSMVCFSHYITSSWTKCIPWSKRQATVFLEATNIYTCGYMPRFKSAP